MKKILILSDTHGYLDEAILNHVQQVDEVWHAGDFGNLQVSQTLSKLKPLRGVYGNVDGMAIRQQHPLHEQFESEGLKIWITHIGGYPGHYSPDVKKEIYHIKPNLFISGHSHILKIMPDPQIPGLLHINPGAAGTHGFHHVRTMVRITINQTKIEAVEVIELGTRSSLNNKNILSEPI